MLLSDNWHQIVDHLPTGVKLLAVSKGKDNPSILKLVGLGQKDFGESRLQEALPKIEAFYDYPLSWHFIGTLQSNKLRKVVKSFDFIHSVSSYSFVQKISEIATQEKRYPKLMIQVKFREDPTKSGFLLNELLDLWPSLKILPNVDVVGLMTMVPLTLPLDESFVVYQECRKLADDLGLIHCSMGMSRDWEKAIDAGATWIRVGSALFGKDQTA